MSEHEMLRPHALCHCAEIGDVALAIIDCRGHSAIPVRSHDGVRRRMHNDVDTLPDLTWGRCPALASAFGGEADVLERSGMSPSDPKPTSPLNGRRPGSGSEARLPAR